jgi:hypothetical protein
MRVTGPFGVPVPEYRPLLRFHFPLIEPDGRISRIRLSDKVCDSHVRTREAVSLANLRRVDQTQRGVQVFIRAA